MADASYDVIVLGTGPGGYETAIRSAQLGFDTAVIEKDKLGGVCLNVGCIPTKALLKSAEVMDYAHHFDDYGLHLDGEVMPNFPKVIERSRKASDQMNQGVGYLMKKNEIDVIYGHGRLAGNGEVHVEPSTNMDGEEQGEETTVEAEHIIVATGASAREIPPLPIDGENVITYREAMLQQDQPERLVVVGAGAIGVEFAYFYHHMGTEVTIIEVLDRVVPNEDKDVSKQLRESFEDLGIEIMTGVEVQGVDEGDGALQVQVDADGEQKAVETDQVLSAVGVVGNTDNVGLEEAGVELDDSGHIATDEFYRTSAENVYAIGDVSGAPWLAHKASHEGILCVEKIAGEDVRPLDLDDVPACTYCQPQIASVGHTEEEAEEEGYDIDVGKFPFQANGKAVGAGHTEGFVKMIYDQKYGELLGCHIIGHNATEMIAEVVSARTLETTGHEIMESMHPHPTLSEAVMEASRVAYGEPINI
jgi:dihydrolipoamide dehydrogenase